MIFTYFTIQVSVIVKLKLKEMQHLVLFTCEKKKLLFLFMAVLSFWKLVAD